MYHTAIKHDVYLRTGEKCNKTRRWVFTAFLEPFFCVLYSDKTHSATRESIAYATKSCEISRGLELKNPSMWQEESIGVPTFYITLFSPKITNLRKQQAPNAATSESNEGRPTCLSVDVGRYVDVSVDTSSIGRCIGRVSVAI